MTNNITISNTDCLRILIALAILRQKGSDQTCFAYVLHLRTVFPSSLATSITPEILWRDHALNLEKEYNALKMSWDDKNLQSFILANTPRMENPSKSSSEVQEMSNHSGPIKKKRRTKGLIDNPPCQDSHKKHSKINLKAPILDNLHNDTNLSSLGDCTQLFVSLDNFISLATLQEKPDFPLKSFLSATHRVLARLSATLDLVLKKNESFSVLAVFDAIFCTVVEKSFPVAGCSAAITVRPAPLAPLADLLNQMLERILIPIVNSFALLSSANLGSLVSNSIHANDSSKTDAKESKPTFDGRPAVLAFFESILRRIHLSCVSQRFEDAPDNTLQCPYHDLYVNILELEILRQSLILELVRHINRVFMEHSTDMASLHSQPTRQSRMMRLVIKDTLWYICSALHIVIGFLLEEPTPKDNSNIASCYDYRRRLELLRRTIINHFTALLTLQNDNCDEAPSMDEGACDKVSPISLRLLQRASLWLISS